VGHVKSCFGLFGDSVRVSARKVHGLRQLMELLGNEARVDARLIPFRDSANLDAT
jgi:hypothetical protein